MGLAVAVKIPGGVNEGIYGVRLAPRGPAALRASGIHELRRRRQRRFTFASKLRIRRQHHGQILVRHMPHPVLRAIDNTNGSAPIALPRNSPILSAVDGLSWPKLF